MRFHIFLLRGIENQLLYFNMPGKVYWKDTGLSPVLFNLMINDVINTVQSVPGIQTLLYADDLVSWATSSSIPALEIH